MERINLGILRTTTALAGIVGGVILTVRLLVGGEVSINDVVWIVAILALVAVGFAAVLSISPRSRGAYDELPQCACGHVGGHYPGCDDADKADSRAS